MKLKATNCPGQSLVEMLIVLFVISVGLYAAVTMIFFNVNLQEQDADQTIAMNLAREALELVQNQRDSNWLSSSQFDAGMLDQPGDCTAAPAWDGTNVPDPFFDFTPNAIAQARIYKSTKSASLGMFTNVVSTSTTDFYRLLTFAPICQDVNDATKKAAADGLCACPPTGLPAYTKQVGLRAKVDMQWYRKSRPLKLTIFSDFYDWR
ncbi:MAG: type IV pilus modification PilV family protein [Patescibacteria group bacterium]